MGRKLHHSVAVNWLGLAIKIGTSLVLLPFIVRMIGVDSYGEYIYLAAIFGYSEMLEFGLRAAILRYTGNLSASGELAVLNRILGTAFSYYAVAAITLIGVGLIFLVRPPEVILPAGGSEHFPLYAALFALVAASNFFRIGWSSVLQGHERYDLVNLIDIGGFLLRAGMIVVLLNGGYGLIAVVLADLFHNLSFAAGSRVALHRVAPGIRLDFGRLEPDALRELLGYSGWAFLNSLAFQFRFRGPSVIIGGAVSTTAAGYFGIATRLQSYVYQLGTAMNAPLRARATVLAATAPREELHSILLRGTRFLALLAGALCGVLFVYSEPLLLNWMGNEFASSAQVLRILLVGLAGEVCGLMIGGVLYATGKLRGLALSNLAEAVCILGLSYWWAKVYGLLGGAAGVAVPLVLNKFLVQPAILLPLVGVSVWTWWQKSLLRPALALGLALGPVYILSRTWSSTSLAELFLQLVVSFGVVALSCWFVALESGERLVVSAKLSSLMPRRS